MIKAFGALIDEADAKVIADDPGLRTVSALKRPMSTFPPGLSRMAGDEKRSVNVCPNKDLLA